MLDRTVFRRAHRVALTLLALAAPAATSRAQTGYSIFDLGTLGGRDSIGSAINASGQVAGDSQITASSAFHAFLYSNSTLTDLNTLGGNASYGRSINDSGVIAGYSNTSSSTIHATVWNGATPTDIGTLGGGVSYARGINNSGQVTGQAQPTGSSAYHAFRYSGSTMTDLGVLAGGINSVGYAINASGKVTGYSDAGVVSKQYPVVWTGTTAQPLDTLGGLKSAGYAINAGGQVVGFSYRPSSNTPHPTVWNGTAITDIGSLGGGSGYAYGINTAGAIVGTSTDSNNSNLAFLYSNGSMIDLNTLLPANSGWNLTSAYAINDSGWITGQGSINGLSHAFLLKVNTASTPAPSSLLVFCLGIAAFGVKTRRRKR